MSLALFFDAGYVDTKAKDQYTGYFKRFRVDKDNKIYSVFWTRYPTKSKYNFIGYSLEGTLNKKTKGFDPLGRNVNILWKYNKNKSSLCQITAYPSGKYYGVPTKPNKECYPKIDSKYLWTPSGSFVKGYRDYIKDIPDDVLRKNFVSVPEAL
tara:strand:+ start:427 stop:885 length:459 start_codon:yes stop_codon:yes gene_type:complete